ncbi:MAG: C10 family peptidase, partial [Bacteroidales bacterium]|nr:C10 family peptidase [Bacteroidales bacterium]
MRKAFIFTGLLLLSGIATFAKQVDAEKTKLVGQTFLSHNLKTQKGNTSLELSLVYTATSTNGQQTTTCFYVYNAGSNGFVIVAGDDRVAPILAYSNEGAFDLDNIAPATRKWLDDYKTQIRMVVEQDISAKGEVQQAWTYYSQGLLPPKRKDNLFVNPLVKTKWDQSPYYNALCPGSSVTGCVATTMAQIMKYWNYPAKGIGSHSYTHSTYGTLSANFGVTTYQWDTMPNTVNASTTAVSKNAVATLMYHCGVSVDMNYTPNGSGAYSSDAMTSFKNYFAYKDTMQHLYR